MYSFEKILMNENVKDYNKTTKTLYVIKKNNNIINIIVSLKNDNNFNRLNMSKYLLYNKKFLRAIKKVSSNYTKYNSDYFCTSLTLCDRCINKNSYPKNLIEIKLKNINMDSILKSKKINEYSGMQLKNIYADHEDFTSYICINGLSFYIYNNYDVKLLKLLLKYIRTEIITISIIDSDLYKIGWNPCIYGDKSKHGFIESFTIQKPNDYVDSFMNPTFLLHYFISNTFTKSIVINLLNQTQYTYEYIKYLPIIINMIENYKNNIIRLSFNIISPFQQYFSYSHCQFTIIIIENELLKNQKLSYDIDTLDLKLPTNISRLIMFADSYKQQTIINLCKLHVDTFLVYHNKSLKFNHVKKICIPKYWSEWFDINFKKIIQICDCVTHFDEFRLIPVEYFTKP